MAISGTKEWSVKSINCWLGCEHRCRYCYARANALRFGKIKSAGEWGTTYNRRSAAGGNINRRYDGPVMFPTTHDITPATLDACLPILRALLAKGNEILIVSKPAAAVIQRLCDRLPLTAGTGPNMAADRLRELVQFRFTIGSLDAAESAYWEPFAPPPAERLYCLAYARYHGFRTSVSAEPLLTADVGRLIDAVDPYVTGTIWIGAMNRIRQRVIEGTDEEEIERIERLQTPKAIRSIYEVLKDHPKIRWKESYKESLGLDRPDRPGLDT